MMPRDKVITLLVAGILFIIAGIFTFRYSEKLAFEWPKNRFLRIFLIIDWNQVVDRKNGSFIIFLGKFVAIASILLGIVCIILAILTMMGKLWAG